MGHCKCGIVVSKIDEHRCKFSSILGVQVVSVYSYIKFTGLKLRVRNRKYFSCFSTKTYCGYSKEMSL